jgi:tripartite-type tricarboxylate transporter receptor subunit TctC
MSQFFARTSNRTFTAIAFFFFAATPVLAEQSYPTRRVQITVPFSAGTALDILARVTAERFSNEFKQPVVVVNQTGASGIIAYNDMAASKDGHTLIFSGQTQLTIQPNIKTDLPYRVEDIVPVCQMFETPFALIVKNDSPFKDFAEFAAVARTRPNTIRFGHSGPATSPHLLGVLLGRAASFEMLSIPYRAQPEQIKDVAAGNIEAAVVSVGSFSPDGVRVLGIFGKRRYHGFPDAPTFEELGLNIPFRSVNGLFAPRGLPAPVITQLQQACARAFDSDEFRKTAARLGVNDELVTGDAFIRQLDDERVRMKRLVEELGLREK